MIDIPSSAYPLDTARGGIILIHFLPAGKRRSPFLNRSISFLSLLFLLSNSIHQTNAS
jgi:hypothetical protein